jgi:death-on-curing protein
MSSWDVSLPNSTVRFLSLDEVVAIHERVIHAFEGAEGTRDLGLLESALYRPQSGYYADLVTMAAALFESLIINHPFVDGNKRVAFFATDVFLRLNGWCLDVEATTTDTLLRRLLADGLCDFERLEVWIRESVRPV